MYPTLRGLGGWREAARKPWGRMNGQTLHATPIHDRHSRRWDTRVGGLALALLTSHPAGIQPGGEAGMNTPTYETCGMPEAMRSRRSTRSAVLGWVEKSLATPAPPLNGLEMNRCAVDGLVVAGGAPRE
jgi:hypothetical protein